MANPTEQELLKSVYAETHQAASQVSAAWSDFEAGKPITVEQSSELLHHLNVALSAMVVFDSRVRGVPPPKIG